MDLRPSSEQRQLVEAFEALYARESSSERVRAAEPLGFDKGLWRVLLDTGAISMAVDESCGGWGASDLDLTLIAEQHGRAVAPAPMIEVQTAARTLARCSAAGSGAARTELDAVLAGEQMVTFAPRPGRAGRLELVPAG